MWRTMVFKVLNLLGTTHPFYVLRVSEIRKWIEEGEYDRIIRFTLHEPIVVRLYPFP